MNIVLVVADTLRNKEISNGDITFLNELEGFISHEYYSNAPWTVPAHATIFTGDLPSEHGVNSKNVFFDKENKLISEISDEGYKTFGISENKLFSDVTGFAHDFDEFIVPNENAWEGENWQNFISHNKSGILDYLKFISKSLLSRDLKSLNSFSKYLKYKLADAEEFNPTRTSFTVNNVIDKLNYSDSPSFVVTNLMPTHLPYTFAKSEREKFLQDLTDSEISKLSTSSSFDNYDADLSEEQVENRKRIYNASVKYLEEKLYEMIDRSPEDTTFVIVGDHGELLGDYEKDGKKLLGHAFGTFKDLIRVPFYVYPDKENIEISGYMDHTQLKDLILSIAKQDEIELGKDTVRSEYFSKAYFSRNFLGEEPTQDIFNRKSFSIVNRTYKFDITSDGEYLWGSESGTETDSDLLRGKELPKKIKEIRDIHYKWRFEDENC